MTATNVMTWLGFGLAQSDVDAARGAVARTSADAREATWERIGPVGRKT